MFLFCVVIDVAISINLLKNGDFIVKNNNKVTLVAYWFLTIQVALSASQKNRCIIQRTE